jgi:hypothetical protein
MGIIDTHKKTDPEHHAPCRNPKSGKAEPQNALPKPTQTQPASQEVKKHQKY